MTDNLSNHTRIIHSPHPTSYSYSRLIFNNFEVSIQFFCCTYSHVSSNIIFCNVWKKRIRTNQVHQRISTEYIAPTMQKNKKITKSKKQQCPWEAQYLKRPFLWCYPDSIRQQQQNKLLHFIFPIIIIIHLPKKKLLLLLLYPPFFYSFMYPKTILFYLVCLVLTNTTHKTNPIPFLMFCLIVLYSV